MIRESSIEAHQSIKPHKETQHASIRSAMRKIGTSATAKSIALLGRLDYHMVARRPSEMERKGQTKVVGRNPHQKNRPLLWELTDNYKIESI